jgi:tryptophan synthase alpha chain
VAGITGTKRPDTARVAEAVDRIKRHTDLPVVVGFGVTNPEQAAMLGRNADGIVVGSALVRAVEASLDAKGRASDATVAAVTALVAELSQGVRAARLMAAE